MYKTHFNSMLPICLAVMVILISSQSLAADTDPTRPFGLSGIGSNNQSKHEDVFTLSSIIHGEGIHTAVINGKIYKMFDYIGEYRITAINSHSVVLRSKSERLKINVFKSKGFKSNVVENTVVN